ncbi:hypothetical protein D9613_012481 [Agrocybe pediades]|uniref:Uncharacterized protein n=1 Tax=Agrocybe pediades TaxID=84607 RepID=A0A8H4QRP4_9AGAR|nr:hypothetical protein D9613_012481 [Agrocybe pediades]
MTTSSGSTAGIPARELKKALSTAELAINRASLTINKISNRAQKDPECRPEALFHSLDIWHPLPHPKRLWHARTRHKDPVSRDGGDDLQAVLFIVLDRLIKRREKQCAKEAAKASKSAAAPASASGAGAKAAAGPFDADLTPNYSGGEGVVPDGTKLDDVDESLAGRIRNIRPSGSKLIFYHLHGEGVKVQIFAAQ